MTAIKPLIVLATALTLATPPAALAQPEQTPVDVRAERVAAFIAPAPGDYEAVFAPSFLTSVPAEQLGAIFAKYHADAGRVTRVTRLPGGTAYAGQFTLACDRHMTVKLDLTVAEAAPHAVLGMLLGTPVPHADSLREISQGIAALPGRTSFVVARLGARGPEIVASHQADQHLAIGSAFKLWILGTLTGDIDAGKHRWTDIVRLSERDRSLPSGRFHTWPVGAPVTLHTLASQMISESDNTATDALLHLLGRARVEAHLGAMGLDQPYRNRPLLSTLEMFKIKAGPDREALATWGRLGEAERRIWLDGTVARWPRESVAPWTQPRGIDKVEWFASAADLARTMSWLRNHTLSPATAPARAVLAINPGLRIDPVAWPYIGYKGGSEPGVLALTFLLRNKDGGWWTLAATWNNDQATLDGSALFGLVERATTIMANITQPR